MVVKYEVRFGILSKFELFEQLLYESKVTKTITLYFASTLDFGSTFLFLVFHDIKSPSTGTQYL